MDATSDRAPDWTEQGFLGLDRQRRWLAHAMDAFGLGPKRTPRVPVPMAGAAALYRYTPEGRQAPAVLIVPAPIKSSDIWDMLPAVSAVRRFMEAGFQVYMIEWPRAGTESADHGLGTYVETFLGQAVETVRRDSAEDTVMLAGHSVGGIFAAIYAALAPDSVRALLTFGSPLHFDERIGALGRMIARVPDTGALIGRSSTVPGSLLNLMSVAASPQSFVYARSADWLACTGDAKRLRLHILVERWTMDESALPRQLVTDIIDGLYRGNALMDGGLTVNGRTLSLADVSAPAAAVVSPACDIAPEAAVLPALERTGNPDTKVFQYPGERGVSLQHVGMLLGFEAHAKLWPRLVEWLRAH